jgi:hypothetical protein
MKQRAAGRGISAATTTHTRAEMCEMVRARTLELASIAGRDAHQIKQADYEQAKRELTGESDFDRQQALLYPADPF